VSTRYVIAHTVTEGFKEPLTNYYCHHLGPFTVWAKATDAKTYPSRAGADNTLRRKLGHAPGKRYAVVTLSNALAADG